MSDESSAREEPQAPGVSGPGDVGRSEGVAPDGPAAPDDALAPHELRSKTLRGLRWTVIGRPATELVLLGSMVVLARLVAPAEFGRYAVAAIVGDVASIPLAGVGAALVQRRSVTREHLQAGFALALLTALALAGLTLAVAGTLVVAVLGERTAQLVRLSSPLCLIVAAGTVSSALLQRRLALRRLSVIDFASAVVRVCASIALALAGLGAFALVLGAIAGELASTAIAWAWARPPLPRLHRAQAGELWRYGRPASLAAASWVGFRNCDYAIVAGRLGALQAGLYFRAYTVGVEYQKKVSKVMTTVGFPVLSRTRGTEELAALRGRMVRLLAVLMFPLLALLAIEAPVFVPWLFGQRWAPAVLPTQILALGGASTLVIDAAGSALMAAGRPRALLGFGWGHFLAYALAVLAVAPLGIVAVALAAAVVHTLFLLVAYVLLLHGSGERPLLRLWEDLQPAMVSCAALGALAVPASLALKSAHASAVPYLAGVSLSGGVAYLTALRLCFPASLRTLRSFAAHLLPDNPLRGASRRLAAADTG
jgi:O-antigen/teichoic acid export membrane protein